MDVVTYYTVCDISMNYIYIYIQGSLLNNQCNGQYPRIFFRGSFASSVLTKGLAAALRLKRWAENA